MLNKKGSNLGYLLLLTAFYLLLQFSFFIQSYSTYLQDFTFVSHHLKIPQSIIPGILYFVFVLISIHAAFCLLIYVVANLAIRLLRLAPNQSFYFTIGCWFLAFTTMMYANQVYYPNSKFAELINFGLSSTVNKSILILLAFICCVPLALAVVQLIKKLMTALLLVASLVVITGLIQPIKAHNFVEHTNKPNVFIIGIDSLRPDFLGYFGHAHATSFLDHFLKRSVVFSHAVTPLARTYPSWMSILTGAYPRETGIRSNLSGSLKTFSMSTLPAILKKQGYETIYATDETRFSNIDYTHGFDEVVTPPMGLNDFLLGTFNDFPLANLLVNTTLGSILFPYSYANRAVYVTYQPDSFLNLVKPLLQRKKDKPLFMAIHFCLPHHPYLWAALSGKNIGALERYERSIQRADQQVKDFFKLLDHYHLLDQAIVVLLSDHGETLKLPGDRITEAALFQSQKPIPRFYPATNEPEEVNQSAGHGTDVLGLPQYRTLLAFRTYGGIPVKSRKVKDAVSLLDIKPTLLALIHLPVGTSSGLNLSPQLYSEASGIKNRHLFLESDFSPQAIRTIYPETKQVILEGVQIFRIDPATTRFLVRDEMLVKIINSKQYADIYNEWILALYPQSSDIFMPILVNLNSGKWTDNLESAFAKQSPVRTMLHHLIKFYGNDIKSKRIASVQ